MSLKDKATPYQYTSNLVIRWSDVEEAVNEFKNRLLESHITTVSDAVKVSALIDEVFVREENE